MPIARLTLPLCAIAAALPALAGCGTAAKPHAPPIRLELSAPADGARVTDGSVAVQGTVSPAGAGVMILGQRVPVTRGAFSAHVALAPGSNIIDVLAGAPRSAAAMAAVRVFRQTLVSIPVLAGDSPSDAVRRLRAIGLVPRTQDNDPFFDALIPVAAQVCGTAPGSGHSVAPGSVVTVTVSKSC